MTDLGPIAAAYPSPPDNHYSPQNPSVPSLYERTAMASSVSPSAGSDKSPLSSLNLGFLKSLTDKRTTRDGNPPKRRGPKPDSKPALTRRQELNRQAQRTHRERKELYIKALEDEVLRLKEIYSNISHDKERLAEENRQLKALLAQNGMSMSSTVLGGSSILDDSISNPASAGYGSSASVSGTHSYGAGVSGGGGGGGAPSSLTSAYTTSPGGGGGAMRGMSPGGMSQGHHSHAHGHSHSQMAGQHVGGSGSAPGPQRNPGVDYDQAGIDFVLTLEKPCMDHLPWLLERGTETGGAEPCGHALMASCPPEPFPELTTDIPFGYANVKGGDVHDNSGQRTWELSKADLATLLDLSKRLNLDGEITPVMAWGMVLGHPRLGELTTADFVRLTEELGSKMRCYGFGAVMEEFEVRDALENVFSTKPEPLSTMAY